MNNQKQAMTTCHLIVYENLCQYVSHSLNCCPLPITENFRFHNEYEDEYEKMFILLWTLQTYLRKSALVERLLGPCSKNVAAICHNLTR